MISVRIDSHVLNARSGAFLLPQREFHHIRAQQLHAVENLPEFVVLNDGPRQLLVLHAGRQQFFLRCVGEGQVTKVVT